MAMNNWLHFFSRWNVRTIGAVWNRMGKDDFQCEVFAPGLAWLASLGGFNAG
jgi:hypothetical protein